MERLLVTGFSVAFVKKNVYCIFCGFLLVLKLLTYKYFLLL